MTVKALNDATIDADAEAVAVSVAIGAVGVAGSVGIGIATNWIASETTAKIAGATVNAGTVTVDADDDALINAQARAAAVSLSAGAVAVSIAVGGANAENVIETATTAEITSQDIGVGTPNIVRSTINTTGRVNVDADATATIDAVVKSTAESLGLGLGAAGASVGFSIAKNRIGSGDSTGVFARIDNSTVNSGGGNIDVTADMDSNIEANIEAFSVAVAAGGFALSAAGTGASTRNVLDYAVMATVDTNSVLNTAGNAVLYDDDPTSGVNLVPQLDADGDPVYDAMGDVTVAATDASEIDASVAAGSVAASVGVLGGSISIAVSEVVSIIGNTIKAALNGSSVLARDVSVTATESNNVDTDAQATSAATGFTLGGTTMAGGGAVNNVTITNMVEAEIVGDGLGDVVKAYEDVVVRAASNTIVDAEVGLLTVAAGVFSLAASGGVVNVVATPTVRARTDAVTIDADTVEVDSDANFGIQADAYGVTASTGLSMGVNTVRVETDATVEAIADGRLDVKDLDVTADAAGTGPYLDGTPHIAVANATASSGGLLLGAASTAADVINRNSVTAAIGAGADVDASGDVTVAAGNIGAQRSDAKAAGLSLLVGAGSADATAVSRTTTIAEVRTGANVDADDVTVRASGLSQDRANGVAGSGALVAGSGVDLLVDTEATVVARIVGTAVVIADDLLDVSATQISEPQSQVISSGFGLIGGTGAEVELNIDSTVSADIGGSSINVGRLTAAATNTVERDEIAGTTQIDGDAGGLASGATARSDIDIDLDTTVNVAAGADIDTAGDMTLTTFNEITLIDEVALFTAGALSGAGAFTSLNANDIVGAVIIGANADLDIGGDFTVEIDDRYDITLNSMTETYGAGTVAIGTADIDLSPSNTFDLGVGANLLAVGDILISVGIDNERTLEDLNTLTTQVDNFAGSAIPIDDLRASIDSRTVNLVEISSGATLESYQNIDLVADKLGLTEVGGGTKGTNWVSAVGDAIDSAFGGSDTLGELDASADAYGIVRNDGTIRTGALRNQELTVLSINPDVSLTATTSAGSNISFEIGQVTVVPTQRAAIQSARESLARYDFATASGQSVSPDLVAYQKNQIFRLEQEMINEGTAVYRTNPVLAADGETVITPSVVVDPSDVTPDVSTNSYTRTSDGATVAVVAGGVTATTIIVDDIVAQAGKVFVNADQMTGSGLFDTPGDASVNIENQTYAQLQVGDILIPQITGGVFFNSLDREITDAANAAAANAIVEQANQENEDAEINPYGTVLDANFTFTAASLASDSGTPSITIRNTFEYLNDPLPDRDGDGNADIPPVPSITVLGNVLNLGGDVLIESNPTGLDSNVNIIGSVQGENVQIIASGTVTILSETDAHISGDPYAQFTGGTAAGPFGDAPGSDALANVLVNQVQSPIGDLGNESIVANVVQVFAEFINVNGKIRAGEDTFTLDLSPALGAFITDLRNGSGQRFTTIPTTITGNNDFLVVYDRVDNELEIKPLRPSGGRVIMEGTVVSTSRTGVISVYSGYPDIDILNNTGLSAAFDLTIKIEEIDATITGQGTIEIKDKGKPDVHLDRSEFIYEAQPEGNIKFISASGTSTVSSTGLTYGPNEGYRYGWSVGKTTETTKTWITEKNSWLGLDFIIPDSSTRPPNDVNILSNELIENSNFFKLDAGNVGEAYIYETPVTVTDSDTGVYLYDSYPSTTWYGKTTFTYIHKQTTRTTTVFTHSIKADYPIALDFFGNDEASINIVGGNAAIVVVGPIKNDTGTTSITTNKTITSVASESLAAGTFIGGKVITLNAMLGVGTDLVPLSVNQAQVLGGYVDITASAGDINVKQLAGDITIDIVTAGGGYDATLTSAGSIFARDGGSLITGASVTLEAGGSIGTTGTPVRVDTGTNAADSLKATANNDVSIVEVAGDLRLDQIIAGGDVLIGVESGDLVDANSTQVKDERARQALINGLWGDLRLTEGEGALDKIEDVKNTLRDGKTREYQTYWSWREGQGANHAALIAGTASYQLTDEETAYYTTFFTDEGTALGLTGADLTAYVTTAIATQVNTRTDQYRVLHARWGVTGSEYTVGMTTVTTDPDVFDPDFVGSLTAEEEARIEGSIKVWTEEELLNGISIGILRPVTDTDTVIEQPNIVGDNITINASGNIGRTGGQELILLDTDVDLTEDQQVILGAAEPDDVFFLLTDRVGATVNFDAAAQTITRTDGVWDETQFIAGMTLQVEGATTANATEEGPFYTIQSVSGNVITVELSATPLSTSEVMEAVFVSGIALDPRGESVEATVDFTSPDTMTVTSGDISGLQVGMKLILSEQRAPADTETELKGDIRDLTDNDNNADSLYVIASISGNQITLTQQDENGDPVAINLSNGTGLEMILDQFVELKAVQVQLRDDIDLAIGGALSATAGGEIFLGADVDVTNVLADGAIELGELTATGDVRVRASNGVTNGLAATAVNITAASAVVEAGQGGIGVSATDRVRVNLNDDGRLTARARDSIFLEETSGTMSVGTMFSELGDIDLLAQGSILDAIDEAFTNMLADNITLRSLTGSIGTLDNALDIETRGDDPTADPGLLTAFAAGDISVIETVGNMMIRNVYTEGGNVQLEANASILDAVDVVTVNQIYSADAAPSTEKLQVDVTGLDVTLIANNGGIGEFGNDLDINSRFDNVNGVVTLLSYSDTNVREGTGTSDSAVGGGLLATAGDLYLNSAGTLAGGVTTAYITATAGAIFNGAAAGASNVTSGRVFLSANKSIGTVANAIQTTVGTIQSVSTTGSTYVVNNGALDVEAFKQGGGSLGQSSGGDIVVTAQSPITISSDINSVGTITLTSTEDEDTEADDITIEENITVSSSLGGVVFNSGDDIIIESGAVVSGFTDVAFNVDVDGPPPAGSSDPATDEVGGVFTIIGTVESRNANVTLSGNADRDTFNLTPTGLVSAAGALVVDLGADKDAILVDQGTLSGATIALRGGADDDTITLVSGATLTGVASLEGGTGEDLIFVDRLITQLAGDSLAIDGGQNTDRIIIQLSGSQTGGANYVIDVNDTGDRDNGADTMTLLGTAENDVFLSRANFVALLHGGVDEILNDEATRPTTAERINYNSSINDRVTLEGLAGNDVFISDDNGSLMTLDGGLGNDSFQFGQLFGNEPVASNGASGVAAFDDIETAETTRGFLSNGITYATTAFGGAGDDVFTVYSNKAVLQLEGEADDDTFVVRAFIRTDGGDGSSTVEIGGGSGNDSIEYNINAPVQIDGGTGFDTVVAIGTEGDDVFLITDEGVRGAGLNVSITNAEEAIEVDGLEGDDTFFIQSTRFGAVTQVIGGLGADTFNVGGDVDLEVKAVEPGGRTGVISLDAASDDTGYNTTLIDGIGTIIADDKTGVVRIIQDAAADTTPGTARVTEADGGSSDVYSVVLTAPPAAAVFVTVSANRSSSADRGLAVPVMTGAPDVTLDNTTSTITRSAGSWIDDGFDQYMSLTLGGAAGDNAGNYVIVSVTDTEIVVEAAAIGDTFAVELTDAAGLTVTGQTAASVQVSNDDGATFADAVVLRFDNLNWNLAQDVTFKAVDDAAAEGLRDVQIVHGVYSTDTDFDAARVENLVVTVDDDDKAGILVTQTGTDTLVLEGDATTEITDSYTVQLTRPPAAGETITVTLGGADGEVLLTDALGAPITELTFTAADWATPQEVNVQAVIADGVENTQRLTLTHAVSTTETSGEYFDAIADPINLIDVALSVTVVDGDSAGVLVRETDGSTVVSTSGDTDTYTVRLTSEPEADVLLTIVDDGQTRTVADSRVSVSSIAGASASVADTFTFDAIADAPDTITRSSGSWLADGFLAGQSVDISVTTDNNGAFQIAEISEDGLTMTLTGNARLIDEVSTSAVADVTVAQITFTAANWWQDVTVTVEEDDTYIAREGSETTFTAQPSSHLLADIRGPLLIDGASTADRELKAAVMLASENPGDIIAIDTGDAAEETFDDRLFVFNDASGTGTPGSLTDSVTTGVNRTLLSGLGMPEGDVTIGADTYDYGISYTGIEITEVLLGQGDDDFTVDVNEQTADGTAAMPITLIQGGGGADEITLLDIPEDSLMVVFGDTDTDGTRYNFIGGARNGNGAVFDAVNDPAGQGDTLDASALGATQTVALYGGIGDDIIRGGAAGDNIAGGGGNDTIFGNGGNDQIYGDSGFTVDLSTRTLTIDNTVDLAPQYISADTRAAGIDTIDAGEGDNVVFGDYGLILQAAGTLRLATTGEIIRVQSTTFDQGQGDIITAGSGNDIIIGGFGGDELTVAGGENILIGDSGYVDFVTLDNDRTDIDAIGSLAEGLGGVDIINSGAGADMIIGGVGADEIDAGDGNNVIIGDNGVITGKDTGPGQMDGLPLTLDRVVSTSQSNGAGDLITSGTGEDVIVGGVGADVISSISGRDIVAGDGALIQFREPEADGTHVVLQMRGYQSTVGEGDTISLGDGGSIVMGGAGADDIDIGAGNSIVFGDSGLLTGAATGMIIASQALITMTSARSMSATVGGDDLIDTGRGSTVVIGGFGADSINTDNGAGVDGADVILGDNGRIVQDTPDGSPTAYLTLIETTANAVGDIDTVTTGTGGDIILLGAGADILTDNGGNNLVMGDNGRIVGLDEAPVDGQGRPITLDTIDTVDPDIGAADLLVTGLGADIVLGGAGGDTITSNAGEAAGLYDGADILIGDQATISFTRDGGAEYADLIRSIDETEGDDDIITAGAGNDIILAGTGADRIDGGADNDLIFGDFAEVSGLIRPQDMPLGPTPAFNFVSISTDPASLGGDDVIYGGAGDDYILGQFGSDTIFGDAGDDDIIGGNNVETDQNGALAYDGGDAIDGGAGDDVILGDNGTISRTFAPNDPRMRALQGTQIYGTTIGVDDGVALVTGTAQANPDGTAQRLIVIFDHSDAENSEEYGDDYIAGGADDDMIFGQLGDDVIQGDGSIDFNENGIADRDAADAAALEVGAMRDPVTNLLTINASVEDFLGAGRDGDDYIEGNGGEDTVFGNLGQDDIVGGSSSFFGGLNGAETNRPDGSDLLFGGAGTATSRNNLGDESPEGRARDADTIVGDNGNIYRLVGTNGVDSGAYLTFNYDTYSPTLRLIPRAVELLDYSEGGKDLNPSAELDDNGAADEIHGEGGDDTIYGATGSDVLFGDAQDDDIIGGWGNDWISGGTGVDGVIGDDGRIMTSRNSTIFGEELFGIAALDEVDVLAVADDNEALRSVINVDQQLKKTVNLTPFSTDPADDDNRYFDATLADDIIFGGWGDDFLHGGVGDDAISGAEALPASADPRDSADNPISFDTPFNPGNVLAYNPAAGEGVPLMPFFDPDDPRGKILINGKEFFLNFDPNEGIVDPRSENGSVSDGDDRIFGSIGNDAIMGGTGRDQLWGGYGDDYINADDNQDGNNNVADPDISYEDFVFGGAGEDILIANTIGDRLVDWRGEFNSYYTPFQFAGSPTVINDYSSVLLPYIYALGAADGADPTRAADAPVVLGGDGLPIDLYEAGEPFGELGITVLDDLTEFPKQAGQNRYPGRGTSGETVAGAPPVPTGQQLAPSATGNYSPELTGLTVINGATDATVQNDQILSAVTGAERPGYARVIGAVTDSEIIIDVAAPEEDGDLVTTYIYDPDSDTFVAQDPKPTTMVQGEGAVLEFRDQNENLFAYIDEYGGLWIIDDLKENREGRNDADPDDWILDASLMDATGLSGAAVLAALPTLRGSQFKRKGQDRITLA